MNMQHDKSNDKTAGQWSLDALYTGFDDLAYVQDCEKFSHLIDEYIAAIAPIEHGKRVFDAEALAW